MNLVFTISPGNSGGGAVHDYINQNTKFENPFYGHEFRLIHDPDGIINLYKNFYNNFSINNTANALMRFDNYCKNISKLKMKYEGKEKRIFNEHFNRDYKDYLDKIVKISYSGLPQFYSLQINNKDKRIFKIKKRLFNYQNYQHNLFKMVIPVNEKIFIKETKKFLEKIFCSKKNKKKNIILDQGLNIWGYSEIFKFYKNSKIIIVTRDPRSVFYSMKSRQSSAYPGHDVRIFVKWYKEIMSRYYIYRKKNKNKNICEIKFENFCKNYDFEKKKILKFINSQELNNTYDVEKTKLNAFKANNLLDKREQNIIKNKLKNYLQW